MKKRLGFVSNSSSCSFCVIGYHLSNDLIPEILEAFGNDLSGRNECAIGILWDELRYYEKRYGNIKILDEDHHCHDKGLVIGVPVVESDDDGLDPLAISLEDALSKLDELREKLQKIPNIDLIPKIFSGTYSC